MAKRHENGIVAKPIPWRSVILVCRKCSKKLGGGFGPSGDRSLAHEIKLGLRQAGLRQTSRVIETKCLGLCPKGAVTVLPASDPGLILSVPAGTEAAAIMARLTPPPPTS